MISPTLCAPTAASQWIQLSWPLARWLSQPALVLPGMLALTGLLWLILAGRWKRKAVWAGGLLTAAYLSLFSPAVAQLGNGFLAALVPTDSGQPADAIVILGRGPGLRPSRVALAAELWRQQRAPQIFASGRGDALEIAQLLVEQGVPASAVDGEPCSATTEENAQFTAAILQPQGVQRIVLISDPPHLLRSLLTFQSLGFEVMAQASPLPGSLSRPQDRFLIVREWVGLVAYGMMGRYFARQVSPSLPLPAALTSLS